MSVIASMGNAIADFWQLMVGLARSFTFKDVIDVAIVTLLIYGVIKLVRETRAGQLVKGLILFIIIFLLSSFLQLDMLNQILTYFFQFAFLAILIVFQPELRKALEQMGRSNVGKDIVNAIGAKDRETSLVATRKAINAVVDATAALQRLKMGALIVMERKTKLGEIVETGTIVDARPTAQLIANIFFNKAPLHDGAVIIRDSRVYCAGCILPLTKNGTLSDALGTRHRAALGISEESDAVVVVVSEETGQISVAMNGVLKRNYNKDTLREMLDSCLLPDEDGQSRSGSRRSLIQKIKGAKS
ncbi:MAG: diadenylate cyclase CdaA [Oscillospiraceae bacterium]